MITRVQSIKIQLSILWLLEFPMFTFLMCLSLCIYNFLGGFK